MRSTNRSIPAASTAIVSCAKSSAASSCPKARSAARTSLTKPAKRRRGSGHGGSRRVVTSSENPGGGRSTSRSNPAWIRGEWISCRSSSTSTTGRGARRSPATTIPGRSSVGAPPATIRRSSSAGLPTTGISAAATARQNTCGSSSVRSRLSQAAARSAAPASIQDAASRVLPHPAVAATSVTGASIFAVRRACREARPTTWAAIGGENFSEPGAVVPGVVRSGGFGLILAASSIAPVRMAQPWRRS